jgi:hypothetical protein
MDQEQEHEQEQEQEEEKEQEIEIEKVVDLQYERTNEKAVPWKFRDILSLKQVNVSTLLRIHCKLNN